MVGKGPVHFAIQIMDFTSQLFQYRHGYHAGSTIACIDAHFKRPADLDIAGYVVGIGDDHIGTGKVPGSVCKVRRLYNFKDFLDLSAMYRSQAEAHLEAVVLAGVVAGGHHDAPFHLQVLDGKIEYRCGTNADVGHIAPRGAQTDNQLPGVII